MKKLFLTFALCLFMLSTVASHAIESTEFMGLSTDIAKELDEAMASGDVDLVASILTTIINNEDDKTVRRVSDYVFLTMPEVEEAFYTPKAVSYFSFNDTTITEDGKRNLTELIDGILGKGNIRMITIAGYADRIGSDEYNEKLAMKRAEVVKDFFVENGVSYVEVEAYGEKRSETSCGGGGVSGSLINCLQPDRKVVISVIPEPRATTDVSEAPSKTELEQTQISGN